jgi:hypothetical protein
MKYILQEEKQNGFQRFMNWVFFLVLIAFMFKACMAG